jgi:hypothetical protein
MPQRESRKSGKIPLQAQDGPERRFEREVAMTRSKSHKDTFSSDHSFPYVLLCSTLGTVVSLASVWIMTAHSYAPAMVA